MRELEAAGTSSDGGRVRAVLVPLMLLIMAGLLWADPWPFTSVAPAAPATPVWAADPTPIRQPKLKPEIQLAGYTYNCSDCHKLFPSPAETTRTLTWHREIVLEHGLNDRCFNCHNRTSRDSFIDDWGQEISWNQPQLMCAKCHGPVYRDWLHGAHGRTNGYWDTRQGTQTRLKCIQCHDPHVPPFMPLQPAPPPNTLRMGDQTLPPEAHGVANPLQIFRRPEPKAGTEERP